MGTEEEVVVFPVGGADVLSAGAEAGVGGAGGLWAGSGSCQAL